VSLLRLPCLNQVLAQVRRHDHLSDWSANEYFRRCEFDSSDVSFHVNEPCNPATITLCTAASLVSLFLPQSVAPFDWATSSPSALAEPSGWRWREKEREREREREKKEDQGARKGSHLGDEKSKIARRCGTKHISESK